MWQAWVNRSTQWLLRPRRWIATNCATCRSPCNHNDGSCDPLGNKAGSQCWSKFALQSFHCSGSRPKRLVLPLADNKFIMILWIYDFGMITYIWFHVRNTTMCNGSKYPNFNANPNSKYSADAQTCWSPVQAPSQLRVLIPVDRFFERSFWHRLMSSLYQEEE